MRIPGVAPSVGVGADGVPSSHVAATPFFGWLIPAAFLLPAWLLVGWAVFGRGRMGVRLGALPGDPAVFIGQLVLTLLVRARGTVRAERAVSWWDVLGFAVWHVLVISLGFFDPVLVGAGDGHRRSSSASRCSG